MIFFEKISMLQRELSQKLRGIRSRSRESSQWLPEGLRGGAGDGGWGRRVKGGFLDAVMAASKSRWYPGVNPPGGVAKCIQDSPSCVLGTSSCPASSFSSLLFSSSFTSSATITSIPLFLVPRLWDRLYQPPLGSLLARAFLLLEGTAFFLVAPAMGGTQSSLCSANEKRDRGNASPRVLRQWRPSSSTTHRSRPSLFLTIPHCSLALLRRSPSPFSHLVVLFSPRAASMFQLSRFFPPPYLDIFH